MAGAGRLDHLVALAVAGHVRAFVHVEPAICASVNQPRVKRTLAVPALAHHAPQQRLAHAAERRLRVAHRHEVVAHVQVHLA